MNKLFAIVCVALSAASAQASYLWWEVNSYASEMGDLSSYIGNAEHPWTEAQVWVSNSDGSDKLKIGSASAANQNDPIVSYGGQINLSSIDQKYLSNTYSYYIELVNTSSSSVVGYSSEKTSYTDLSGSITETLSDMPSVSVWHGGSSFKAVPEPTSAILMLLGVAGLALRRKQRKQA